MLAPARSHDDLLVEIHECVTEDPKFTAAYLKAVNLVDFAMLNWRKPHGAKPNEAVLGTVEQAVAVAFRGVATRKRGAIVEDASYDVLQRALVKQIRTALEGGLSSLSDDNLAGVGLPTRSEIRYAKWRDWAEMLKPEKFPVKIEGEHSILGAFTKMVDKPGTVPVGDIEALADKFEKLSRNHQLMASPHEATTRGRLR
jgi:hypothetical protein